MTESTSPIVFEQQGYVLVARLNRPKQYNALSTELIEQLAERLVVANQDPSVRCAVLLGSPNVFAAGADLKEMQAKGPMEIMSDARAEQWSRIARFDKPLIAGVCGFALGGGCELAMHADIILAGSNAEFGQPEINLGIMPGAGGTQRLVRAVGKSKAMELCLSGGRMSAEEAMRFNLVSSVHPPELIERRCIELAEQIATKAPVAARMIKEAVNRSFETGLNEGLLFEKRVFAILAGTEDRDEGIQAFLEKRSPVFKGQ